MRDRVDALLGVASRCCRDLVGGRLPPWVLLGLVIPAAYVSFGLGVGLSLAGLPRGFDLGRCVISRLCSSHHNPDGYRFLMCGLIALATFLVPLPAYLTRSMGGCAFLRTRGRRTYWTGLFATALIAVERGLCPTHWTRFEVIHLMLAAVAFGGLWLGLAIIAGAPDVPRVRWRWLWRPPWFLTACVLPIFVVVGLYFPFRIMPVALARALRDCPRPLVLLRTETFWQWYLVMGLLFSTAAMACRASRLEKHGRASVGAWRIDAAQAAAPHRGAGAAPGHAGADEAVGESPAGRPTGLL